MSKKGTRHLKESEFNKIVGLKVYGLSAKQIALVTNRGTSTISQILQRKDFKDYKTFQKERLKASKLKRASESLPRVFDGMDVFATAATGDSLSTNANNENTAVFEILATSIHELITAMSLLNQAMITFNDQLTEFIAHEGSND